MYKYNQKENEWEMRKRLRLEQVRQQSKEFAHELRNKVSKEQKVKLKEIEQTKKKEHANWQRKTLNELNQEYVECIRNVGVAHANIFLGTNSANKEQKNEHVMNMDEYCSALKKYDIPEKLLPALIKSKRASLSLANKPANIKPAFKQVNPKLNKTDSTLNKRHVERLENIISDETSVTTIKSSMPKNDAQENKENEYTNLDKDKESQFSQISNLINKSSMSQSSFQNKQEKAGTATGIDYKPHFSQISNLLKITANAQGIDHTNNKNDDPTLDSKPHFSQISNLVKQRRASQLERITSTNIPPIKEAGLTDELKRRPSVVSFKSPEDAVLIPATTNKVPRQSIVNVKKQTSDRNISNGYGQVIPDNKVQMYDNRTKFAKEYIPQQSLTQRTSTNRESPNAMELAEQENERMLIYLNCTEEKLKKDLERGECAIEREKLIRNYKTLLNDLEKLSTEEKTLKSYIHSHQPSQYEPKMQNTKDFIEKRTIITSTEVRKQNSNYINVASIRGMNSNRSESSTNSIMLDYEESLILENLSETSVNADVINKFHNKISPIISEKVTHTNVRDNVEQTVSVPLANSHGKKFLDTPLKITIQIQSSERQEPVTVTPKETNLKLSHVESNSSSVTEYRSLPKTFTGSSRPATEPIVTGRSPQQNKDVHQSFKEIVKEAELECYIRKLLQMSKESVDELPNVADVSSVRESIVDTTSNSYELKQLDIDKTKISEKPCQFGVKDWCKGVTNYESLSKSSSNTSQMSSGSQKNLTKVPDKNRASYKNTNISFGNVIDASKQFDALTENCNQRIIELTGLMSKVRNERQQILERTSFSSGANVPNNSTEYQELPSRLLLDKKKPSSLLNKSENNRSCHELSTNIKKVTVSKSSAINVDQIINEIFTESSSDPKIDVVPYQSKEKLEETTHGSVSQESLLDVYTELKRRNILPGALIRLASQYENQSPKSVQPSNDETHTSIETEILLNSTSNNRHSLLVHSISSNGNTSSSTSTSLSKPALNLKEFLERELTKNDSSSDSVASSKHRNLDKGHRTSTPVLRNSSSKSTCLSIDAQSNFFSGESQISSVKSNTSTWDSA